MVEIRLSDVVPPAFGAIWRDWRAGGHRHYWLGGGRGSGKSTFAALAAVFAVMAHGGTVVVLRKTAERLSDSVIEQVAWVVRRLGCARFWEYAAVKGEMSYSPNGGRIVFRGLSEPKRLKSFKADDTRLVWFEEADEFGGEDELRVALQTLVRGSGESAAVFYTFNPPPDAGHWINRRFIDADIDEVAHKSTYLDMPPAWLGAGFAGEAERLKRRDFLRYRNEYLGEVGTTGGEVFANVRIREITDDEINGFKSVRRGIDFGFAVDPFVYLCVGGDGRGNIFLFHEIYERGLSNAAAARLIKAENGFNGIVKADSAEPKSIDELRQFGLRVVGAKKGKDSVRNGVRTLQRFETIVVDPKRCPNAAREFAGLKYARDKDGNYMSGVFDGADHAIDAARYALEAERVVSVAETSKKRALRFLL